MDIKGHNMHPLSTPHTPHFATAPTPSHTDDDINAAVTSFLSSEGSKLHSQNWQDTTAEVTQWLAGQIQKEREGWRQKTRAAMLEIENHRKEVLRYQGLIQEWTDQMKIVAECCDIPDETLARIAQQDPKQALPMYIESLTETLNALMEDRIMCLQILRADKQTSKASLPNLLKAYIEALKHHAERAHKEAKHRLESLESANKQSFSEMQKLRKKITKKQEEVEKLHKKLQEIKEVTMNKFREVSNLQIHRSSKDSDDQDSHKDLPMIGQHQGEGTQPSPPASLYSAPTPLPAMDQRNIQISEERLSKLRRSAKKLESSLNNALSEMDTFRKGIKPPTKVNELVGKPMLGTSSNLSTPRPFNMPEVPPALKKDMKLLPSPMHMWSTRFEINGPKVQDAELEYLKQQEREKEERKRKAKEKRLEALQKSQERMVNNPDAPTFRSLMKSLDDVKKTKGRVFKPIGQVTKCLRCNKLFTLNDNHKKSCNYHPKGKERIEQYSDRGKLVKVTYVWKCCMMGPDNPGCTYGQHV